MRAESANQRQVSALATTHEPFWRSIGKRNTPARRPVKLTDASADEACIDSLKVLITKCSRGPSKPARPWASACAQVPPISTSLWAVFDNNEHKRRPSFALAARRYASATVRARETLDLSPPPLHDDSVIATTATASKAGSEPGDLARAGLGIPVVATVEPDIAELKLPAPNRH